MKLIFILKSLFIFICLSCSNDTNCDSLDYNFSNYSNAIQIIEKAKFAFKDELTPKSEWIISAYFFSCNKKDGFLIIKTEKGKEYIHSDLPIEIWINLKNSESFGSYYSKKIRGKYQLELS